MEKPDYLVDSEEHAQKEWLKIRIEFDQALSSVGVLQGENQRLRSKHDHIAKKLENVSENYDDRIEEYVKRIKTLTIDVEEKSIEVQELQTENELIVVRQKKEIDDIVEKNKKEVHELQLEVGTLVEQKDGLEGFSKQKEQMINATKQMESELKAERRNRSEQVNQLERDKIKATEKLRKEMLHKIKETKANLLALNDEQLQTTTRLTILQNHQLTTELEYQSKQTEQLVYKNTIMVKEIQQLKRDIQIHKEVEKELAKRSHFCQKVIKKLKQQVKDITEKQSNQGMQQTSSHRVLHNISGVNPANGPMSVRNRNKPLLMSFDGQSGARNDELVSFLEHKLEEVERTLNRTRKEYDMLQSDYLDVRAFQQNNMEKYKKAALLLTEYLDDILTETPNILESNGDMHLNLEKIKSMPMENLPKEDKVALVLVLLKQLQPYISGNNLQTGSPPPQGPLYGSGKMMMQNSINQSPYPTNTSSQYKSVPMHLTHDEQVQKHTDDLLRTGGSYQQSVSTTVSGSQEVDALQSILNNINVQTSTRASHNNMIQTIDPDKLPPI